MEAFAGESQANRNTWPKKKLNKKKHNVAKLFKVTAEARLYMP